MPILKDPTPLWMKPGQESVLDSPMQKVMRILASVLGAHDATGQVMGIASPLAMAMAKPVAGLPSEAGWLYHATNADNAIDIAKSGLKPHRPWFGTDQSSWPDGAADPRSYFSRNAGTVWQFAPENGQPVVIRVKESVAKFMREQGTGDVITRQKLTPDMLEVLDDELGWIPLREGVKR